MRTQHCEYQIFFILCNIFLILQSLLFHLLENRVLRRIFGPKRDEVTGEDFITSPYRATQYLD
jgi:hypothetical protein